MQNESIPTHENCNFGSISFQMLTEVLRARSFDILEALSCEQVDVSHIRRLATHMSLSADDLINVTGLIKAPLTQSAEYGAHRPGLPTEPSSLHSVLELSKIAAKHRLKERSLQLVFEPPCQEHFISGNPWEVSWVLFFILNRIASSQEQRPMELSEIQINVTNKQSMVDVCIDSALPLTAHELSDNVKIESTLFSELEWYCLSHILRKNDLYLTQREVVSNSQNGKKAFELTLRLPTFQPGFE
jgi:hypothetical protein